MASQKASGSGGGGGRSGRQGQSSGDNWKDHNLNSSDRVDLTRAELREQRINDLRLHGVPERELSVRFEVPEDHTQGPDIDPLIMESSRELTLWKWKRHEFFYLLLFGDGSKQCDHDMDAINEFIAVRIRPRVKELADQVIALRGKPMVPPVYYKAPLDKLKLPSATFTVKGKGKGKGNQ